MSEIGEDPIAAQVDPAAEASAGVTENQAPTTSVSYDPSQRTVDASTETAQGQLSNMLNKDSPLAQRARQEGYLSAGARGLQNTSIASEAAFGALVDRSAPLALQDAQTYAQASSENTGYLNKAAEFGAGAANTASLTDTAEAGATGRANAANETQTAVANLDAATRTAIAQAGFDDTALARMSAEQISALEAASREAISTGQNISAEVITGIEASSREAIAAEANATEITVTGMRNTSAAAIAEAQNVSNAAIQDSVNTSNTAIATLNNESAEQVATDLNATRVKIATDLNLNNRELEALRNTSNEGISAAEVAGRQAAQDSLNASNLTLTTMQTENQKSIADLNATVARDGFVVDQAIADKLNQSNADIQASVNASNEANAQTRADSDKFVANLNNTHAEMIAKYKGVSDLVNVTTAAIGQIFAEESNADVARGKVAQMETFLSGQLNFLSEYQIEETPLINPTNTPEQAAAEAAGAGAQGGSTTPAATNAGANVGTFDPSTFQLSDEQRAQLAQAMSNAQGDAKVLTK